MTDCTLLQEFAKELKLVISRFKLDQRVFQRKLKVAVKNVNRWKEANCWPRDDHWEEYKSTALEFLSDAQRPLLETIFAQLDELISRKKAMKSPRNSQSALKVRFVRADRDLVFWHTFRDRDEDGKSIGSLIRAANERIIISGATLHQLAFRFQDDILAALNRHVLVGIIRAHLTPDVCRLYEPYGRVDTASLSTTAGLYGQLCSNLSVSQKKFFGLFETEVLLTHSIGLYDDELFIAEFVMRQHSEHSPSYMPPLYSSTYNFLLSEVLMLLETADPVFGDAYKGLVNSVKRDLGRSHDL